MFHVKQCRRLVGIECRGVPPKVDSVVEPEVECEATEFTGV